MDHPVYIYKYIVMSKHRDIMLLLRTYIYIKYRYMYIIL